MNRRRFLTGATGAVAAAVAGSASGAGSTRRRPRTRRAGVRWTSTRRLRSGSGTPSSASTTTGGLAPGYQIIGYSGDDFTGTAWTFTADNPDLRVTGTNDAVASLKVQFDPGAWLRLTNVTDGLVLDSGGGVPSGADLKQWTWNGSNNLQWTFTAV